MNDTLALSGHKLLTMVNNPCHMIRHYPETVVQLGKHGDIISILPALRAIYQRTGKKPELVVSKRYAELLEGIGYVRLGVVNEEWPQGTQAVLEMARKVRPDEAIATPHWWLTNRPNRYTQNAVQTYSLGGKSWLINSLVWPSYMDTMYDQMGFTRQELKELPLEFDRRDVRREQELWNLYGHVKKDVILVNLHGESSPFPHTPEIWKLIPRGQFHVINLEEVRAHRIYDLLGLYDRAALVITTDTATLHLAAASNTPYIALVKDGWTGSVCKRRCRARVPYSKVLASLPMISEIIAGAYTEPLKATSVKHDPENPPSFTEQSVWKARYVDFSRTQLPPVEGTDYFNCTAGMVEGQRSLVVRRARPWPGQPFGRNDLVMFNMDWLIPTGGTEVQLRAMHEGEHFEDPRLITHKDRAFISCCNFVWGQKWTGAHQALFEIKDWKSIRRFDVVYGKNGPSVWGNRGMEKNWLWFFHDDLPHLLYQAKPHIVARCNGQFEVQRDYMSETPCDWNWGEMRGGTAPVRIGDEYWTFFHSSLVWPEKQSRRYHMGAYAFAARPPFEMTRISAWPILSGSQQDLYAHPKPLVIFPCGAVLGKDMKWFVTFGVNDIHCGYIEIPHKELVETTKAL